MLPAERNPRIRRVELELRANGINRDANPLRSGIHNRGYLPHVKREGAVYFVTYRLADSLPQEVLLKFESERAERRNRFFAQQEARKRLGESVRIEEDLEEIELDFGRQVERFLDTGCGECWLRRPEVANLVASALRFFEGQRYRLDEWVVMPNHVHAVVWPMPNQTLSAILQSWKRFTAREANKILRRTGQPFWQPESFDHWIRNDQEHARFCRYVQMNPVNAGLCSSPEEWHWSSAWRGEPSTL
jgi:REP element-mobilizing transposase RayT